MSDVSLRVMLSNTQDIQTLEDRQETPVRQCGGLSPTKPRDRRFAPACVRLRRTTIQIAATGRDLTDQQTWVKKALVQDQGKGGLLG